MWSASDAGDVALAAWGWRLTKDLEARRHWGPRARGVAVDSERGFRFRGRRRALEEIVAWLGRPRLDRRVLVVTGSPGVGKSAVLGRIVTTADPGFRSLLPPGDDGVKAAVGSVACAVHAKGKTALEVATEIAQAASAEVPADLEDTAALVRVAIEERRAPRFNVVVDALDEAQTPAETRLVVEKVVRPLVETCADVGVQMVVGSRRHDGDGDLLAAFGPSAALIDLDLPGYFALEDLAAYALASLQLVGAEREDSPYADAVLAMAIARRIAEMADRNFLVAGLVARDHGLHDVEAVRSEHLAFTPSVELALASYVERASRTRPIPHELALEALAFAEAPGFTPCLWAIVIEALGGTALAEEDLMTLARSSAANFLVEHGEGLDGPIFRLFHQALNDALLSRRCRVHSASADEAAITRALLAHGQSLGWAGTPAYLLRSLPTHAARAGLLEELLGDDHYLLHADLLRLLAVTHETTTPLARRRARLLRLTPEAVRADPPVRTALFSVTGVLDELGPELGPVRHQPYRGRWAVARRRAEVATLEGHTDTVWSACAVEAGGRTLLASGSTDRTVRLWDPASGAAVSALDSHTVSVWSICAFETGGRTLLASGGGDDTIRLWDPASGAAVSTLKGHTGSVWSVCAFETGGRTLLASGGVDRTVRLWEPASGAAVSTLEGHTCSVLSVCAFETAGRTLLASGGGDDTIRLWDPASGDVVSTLEGHTDSVLSVCAFKTAGRTLLASGSWDNAIRLWDPASGEAVATLKGHSSLVFSICAFETGGRTLLASGSNDRTVRLWDPASGEAVAILKGHTHWVRSVCAFETGGRTLVASGSDEDTIRLWDPASGEAVSTREGHTGSVLSICAFETGGRTLLASGGDDDTIRLWDPASGEAVSTLKGHTGSVWSVCAFETGGRTLLASGGEDRTIYVWDPVTGEAVSTLKGHTGTVWSVCAFENGGRTLVASGSGDDTVRLWDPVTGEAVSTLKGHTGTVWSVCAFENGGRTLLASVGNDTVHLWDPATGEVVSTEGHTGSVLSICAFETGGRTLLASGSWNGTVRLWDPVTGEAVSTLEGHTDWVRSICAFETGGRTLLASGSNDRTVRLWDVAGARAERVVPVRYPVASIAAVTGGLAVALTAGVLVLDVPAPFAGEVPFGGLPRGHVDVELDFFVSYTGADVAWAEWIAWELEAAGNAVCVQAWDSRPGSDFVAEMERALGRAKRVLAVLSPAYVSSPFAMAEWRAAFADDPEGRSRRLVPVRVADFRPPGLHASRIYIDLVGASENEARAALLAGVQAGRRKPRRTPSFPARSSASAPRFPPSGKGP